MGSLLCTHHADSHGYPVNTVTIKCRHAMSALVSDNFPIAVAVILDTQEQGVRILNVVYSSPIFAYTLIEPVGVALKEVFNTISCEIQEIPRVNESKVTFAIHICKCFLKAVCRHCCRMTCVHHSAVCVLYNFLCFLVKACYVSRSDPLGIADVFGLGGVEVGGEFDLVGIECNILFVAIIYSVITKALKIFSCLYACAILPFEFLKSFIPHRLACRIGYVDVISSYIPTIAACI